MIIECGFAKNPSGLSFSLLLSKTQLGMSVAFNPCAVNANKAILRGVGKSLVGRLSNGGENVSTRNSGESYMGKVTILLIAIVSALSTSVGKSKAEPQVSENAFTSQASAIRLTIVTVGPMFGPPTNLYRVGEQILVRIDMTNMSSQPTYVCVSSDLYQDLPRLTKDGLLLPYTKWQADQLVKAQKDQTCQHEDLPEPTLLKVNEPTVVDTLVLGDDSRLPTGALYWYDPLTPGVYELSLQRRLGCCDGPMIESNKISFKVVP